MSHYYTPEDRLCSECRKPFLAFDYKDRCCSPACQHHRAIRRQKERRHKRARNFKQKPDYKE